MKHPIDTIYANNDFEIDAETLDQVADPVVTPTNCELVEVWVGPASGTLATPHSFEVFVGNEAAARCTLNLLTSVTFPSFEQLGEQSVKVFLREGDAIQLKNKTVGAVVNLRHNYVLRQL